MTLTARISAALAVLASTLALVNEFWRYRHTGAVDWVHIEFTIGMLLLIFAVLGSSRKAPAAK